MTPELVWRNVATYSMQVGLVIGFAAFVPAVLRLKMPRARLAYWHILLAACLALPLLQSWRHDLVFGDVDFATVAAGARPGAAATHWNLPTIRIALWILAAGVAARLGWLAAGCIRLWIYRRRSRVHAIEMPIRTAAELRLSRDVASPVTFGYFRPVVLVPPQFPALEPRAQTAILIHELLHIERGDWLFTLAEEVIRSILWFHPAIWWLLGEIQLTREQAVDRAVIDLTDAREEYLDALLAIAGVRPQPDLALAPLFLRRRHLKERVSAILKEARMSRARLVSTMAGSLSVLAAACWLVTVTFPLAAAPRTPRAGGPTQSSPAPAVPAAGPSPSAPARVRVGGNIQQMSLVYQPHPTYPRAAKEARVQGVVKLRAIIANEGRIQQLEVISGHPLLVPAAMEAVRQWVYRPTLLNGSPVEVVTQIDVNFTLSH